jgi:hypothetical protein
VIFCREAYQDAEGLFTHLSNVDDESKDMLKNAGVIRVEIHGPADELESD